MCPQPKPWTQRTLPAAEAAARLAADQAWLAKCVADRRRSQSETGTLHTQRASMHGFAACGM